MSEQSPAPINVAGASSLAQAAEAEAGKEVQKGLITTDAETESVETEQKVADKQKKTDEEGGEEKEKQPRLDEDKKFAQKFAALGRREKALKAKERELQAKIQELEAKAKAASEPKQPEKEPLEVRLKKDPLNTLKELGYDLDTIANIALNGGKLPDNMQQKLMQEEIEQKWAAKIKELEDRLERKEREEEEKRHSQTIAGFKNEIRQTVTSSPEFELLQMEGDDGIEYVFDVINEHYNSTQEVMSIKDAASAVEDYLLEQAKKKIEVNKIKKLLGSTESKPAPEQKAEKKAVAPTLSNTQSQNVPSKGAKLLSREESLREAAKLINWTEE